jgi:uncharacterized membrane protein YebE (DUF533 family)
MHRTLSTLAAVALTTCLAGTALADTTATPRVHRRQVRQQERIAQGVHSGQLTPRETARLEAGQGHVAAMKERAKSDGVVTPRERARLAHAQNVQSRHIDRAKHNRKRSA